MNSPRTLASLSISVTVTLALLGIVTLAPSNAAVEDEEAVRQADGRDADHPPDDQQAVPVSEDEGEGLQAERMERSFQAEDEEAVRQAVLDYVEGIYEIDPSRIERGVHPRLRKLGFFYSIETETYRGPRGMSFDKLRELAGRWNTDGRVDPATAVKEVTIYEVLDQTATVKLTADWGIDYMHLAKFGGRWLIINVLWQSPPRMQ